LGHRAATERAYGQLLEGRQKDARCYHRRAQGRTREYPEEDHFYDIDPCQIERTLTECEKGLYLRKIKGDITYFSRSLQKAHMSVDIIGCNPGEAWRKVESQLAMALSREQRQEQEQTVGTAGKLVVGESRP
jgi:hypothetical protein